VLARQIGETVSTAQVMVIAYLATAIVAPVLVTFAHDQADIDW
jgi:hypothetical protein